jgi:electron transfer flavoprotein beta subunit
VLYWLAERLGLAAVCPVSKIESVENGSVTVHRLIEDGYQRVRVQLPALLGISSEINEPRLPSLKGTMAAGRVLISGLNTADLAVPAIEPKVELRRLAIQVRTTKADIIEAESGAARGAALADRLYADGIL